MNKKGKTDNSPKKKKKKAVAKSLTFFKKSQRRSLYFLLPKTCKIRDSILPRINMFLKGKWKT